MRTPVEITNDQNEKIEVMKTEDGIVAEILNIINVFKDADISEFTGDELSRAAVKLSVLLVNLGQEVSTAELTASSAYIYRKWKKAGVVTRLLKESNMKVTQVKETVENDMGAEAEQELIYRHIADILKSLYDDAERLVSVIQSRLRILTNEEIRTKV